MWYDVVLRSDATVRIADNQRFEIQAKGPNGTITLSFQTQYADYGLEALVPRDLVTVVSLDAPGLVEAASQGVRIADRMSAILSIVGNGAVYDPKAQLVLGKLNEPQEFAQFFVPETQIPGAANLVDPAVAAEVVIQIEAHVERDRMLTAIRQYSLAMRNWRPIYETIAISHLFAGMEALTPIAVEAELQAGGGIDRGALAKAWGVKAKDVDGEARKRILFQGDADCHKKASKARHGYVHGFLTFDAVDTLSAQARDNTAAYLRAAIFRYLKLRRETVAKLTNRANAISVGGHIAGITGVLTNSMSLDAAGALDFRLAVEDARFPKAARTDGNGMYTIDITSNSTLRVSAIASGLTYTAGTNMTSPPTVTAIRRGESAAWETIE
jgi:hypothetical protein